MPINYEGINGIITVSPANPNLANIANEAALYSIFESPSNSPTGQLSANNYMLGWDQYFLMTETAAGFTINGTYSAVSNAQLHGLVPGAFRQVVTRGVSACTSIHLAEGNRHFFLHCNIGNTAKVMNQMLNFIRQNHNPVQMHGSFYNVPRCDEILNTLFREPNLKAKHVLGRGHTSDNCLIHSEIGVEANGAGGIFFGDYFIVDNVARNFASGFSNDKYCFHAASHFNLFQLN